MVYLLGNDYLPLLHQDPHDLRHLLALPFHILRQRCGAE
ncbi:MAG: CbtB-domain containing protein [Proteobacteria bacterium]|nr:CbtB-domain containing protein [Pseudomonadota bacterium]